MMVSNLYRGQAKKHNTFRTGFIGTAILTVLWVVLSLFAIPCTGVEAAVPKPEEISGEYHYYEENIERKRKGISGHGSGTVVVVLRGNTLQLDGMWTENVRLPYNAKTGTAHTSFTDKHGQLNVYNIRWEKYFIIKDYVY